MVRARGAARDRVIGAAVELFAENGVQGTSLQMIGDRLGVAKGAVYYQFQTKDDIVLALLRPVFDDIEALVRAIESEAESRRRREIAISGVVDLALQRRGSLCLFRRDPVVEHLIAQHEDLRTTADRLRALLLGTEPDVSRRISLSVALAGLYFCTTDPALRDVPDADLREILLSRFVQCVSAPAPPAASPPRPAVRQPDSTLRDWAPSR